MTSIRERNGRYYVRFTVRSGRDKDGKPAYKWIERGGYDTVEEAEASLKRPIRKRRHREKNVHYISGYMIDRILNSMEGNPEKQLAFLLSLHYHLSIPELCGLSLGSYNRQEQALVVNRYMCQGERGRIFYRPLETKIIFLSDDDSRVVEKYIHKILSIAPYLNYPTTSLFVRLSDGQPLTPRSFRYTTAQIRKNIYPDFNMADWRRTYEH